MKRTKTILKHVIAIALMLQIPVVALCCEKRPLPDISHLMNEHLIRKAIVTEEWEPARIEYEPAWTYENNDSENMGKTGKQDYWYLENDPVGFDVVMLVLVVLAVSLFIVSCIMTYKIIHGNPATNLKEGW